MRGNIRRTHKSNRDLKSSQLYTNMDKIDKADWGYVPLDPEPGFDAEHNRRVIDDVMRKNRLNLKRKKREQDRGVGERSHAVASYVKSIVKDKSNTSPEDYFGKRYLAKLRGKEIIEIMKNAKKKQESQKEGR